jgi:hypothetical protein
MQKSRGKAPQHRLNYGGLVDSIARLHARTQAGAAAAVNQFLTLRNWLIGACIVEFEQRGLDRARYGERLLSCLSKDLCKRGIRGCSQDRLEWMRRFYTVYPQIRQTLSDESPISATASRKSTAKQPAKLSPEILLHLSWSHLIELIRVEDPWKRAFYESERLKGNWSVRQLQRQIG